MTTTVYTDTVQKLYLAYFNRPGEPTGVAFWEAQLAANGGNVAAISDAFSNSLEYKTLYAGLNNDQLINALYWNLFGREAEPAGLLHWSLRMTQGLDTIASIALSLVNGAQGTDADAIANKLAAANAFTQSIDTTPEIVGYSGYEANSVAREWLKAVTDDASLASAMANVDATLAGAVAAREAVVNAGSTFTLTIGADEITGTARNDKIVAIDNGEHSTGPTNTLSIGDVIDGGAGEDTLSIVVGNSSSALGSPDIDVDLRGAEISNVEKLEIKNAGDDLDDINLGGIAFHSANFANLEGYTDIDGVLSSTAVNIKGAKGEDSYTDVYFDTDDSSTTVEIGNNVAGNGKGNGLVGANFYHDLTAATTIDASLSLLRANSESYNEGGYNSSYAWQEINVGAENADVTTNILVQNATYSGDGYGYSSYAGVAITHDGTATVTANITIENSDSVVVEVLGDYGNNGSGDKDVANITLDKVKNSSYSQVDVIDFETVNITVDGDSKIDDLYTDGGFTNFESQTVSIVANADLTITDDFDTADEGSVKVSVFGHGNVDLGRYDGTTLSDTVTDEIDASGMTGKLTVEVLNAISSVKGGSGNDDITLNQQLVAGMVVNGGAGVDALKFNNTIGVLTLNDYALITGVVSNFEQLEFNNGVTVDASKLPGYTKFTFDQASTITKATQALVAHASLDATASGYVAAVAGPPAVPTTYAGSLNITADGDASTITAKADSATVTVKAGLGNVGVVITGDLKTSLTIDTVNGANAATNPTGDTLASAAINSGLAALTAVTLKGNGTVVINDAAAVKLATIDASALGGTLAYGDAKGEITGGLQFTSALPSLAETIKLGAGHDIVTIASTYGAMDSISGFDAVKETNNLKSTTDVLNFAGLNIGGGSLVTEVELTSAQNTLALAFVKAAADSSAAADAVVFFNFGGNTYLFKDVGATPATDGILDNADLAVKLVGTYDLSEDFSVYAA